MRIVPLVGVVALALVATRPAQAQWKFGPELSWASNSFGVGIGARAEVNLVSMIPSAKNFSAIGSFDYFFPSTGIGGPSPSYWEINVDGAYHFDIPSVKAIAPYAGAGLDIGHLSYMGYGASEVGLNLMGGTNFKPLGKVIPFAELRIELRTASAIVLTGGVLF